MLIKCLSNGLDESVIKNLMEIKKWENHLKIYRELEIVPQDYTKIKVILEENRRIFDIFSIDAGDLKDSGEEYLIDFMLEIAETDYILFLKNATNLEGYFNQVLDELDVNNIYLTPYAKSQFTLKNLTRLEEGVIREIFEMDSEEEYKLIDFLTQIHFKSNQILHTSYLSPDNGRVVGNICKEELINCIEEEGRLKQYMSSTYYDYPFPLRTAVPPIDIKMEDLTKILEYKWKVFSGLKFLTPKNMSELPKEVIAFCNKNEFVPYEGIIEVIGGSYPLMKYYYNGGEKI